MGWLRLVGSLKLYVSFAKEPYKRDYILQKGPIILRSLLIVATPYHMSQLATHRARRRTLKSHLATHFSTESQLTTQFTTQASLQSFGYMPTAQKAAYYSIYHRSQLATHVARCLMLQSHLNIDLTTGNEDKAEF